MTPEIVLQADNISYAYKEKAQQVSVFKQLNLSVAACDSIAIVGASVFRPKSKASCATGIWVLSINFIIYYRNSVP